MSAYRIKQSRRGGIYLMVMIGSATVTSIALVGLSVATERRHAAERAVNAEAATQLAHAALEIGIHTVATDPTWRWSKGNGWWFKDQALEGGVMALGASDREGGLVTDGACRPVVLRGVGMQGTSRIVLEVELEPEVVWPDDGLVVNQALGAMSYWPMTLDKAEPKDLVGANNGRWKGSAGAAKHAGVSCTSSHGFNGTDDYVEIATTSSHRAAAGSIAMWFVQTSKPTTANLFTKWNGDVTSTGDTQLALKNGVISFSMHGAAGTATVTGAAAEVSQWHHVVATFGSGGVSLYLNGVLQGTDSVACNWLSNSRGIVIGAGLEGSVAHISLYDRALTEGEVATLYDAHRTPPVMRIVPGTWKRATD